MSSVDVIIPVRDGAAHLAEAIESALGQTLPPARVIVVDDGSADESAEIAEGLGGRVTTLRRPPRGGPAALNAGLEESGAGLVAFLDADDVWHERKLELQTALLEGRPGVHMTFGHLVEFVSPEATGLGLAPAAEPVPGVMKSTLLVRRAALDRVGRFDESYALVDFPEWYARARAEGLVEHVLPDVVARRRLHASNLTRRRKADVHAEYLRAVRADLARRRATEAAS